MIVVDTSVWIDHLRSPVHELARLLGAGSVIQHPHVTIELALGSLADRAKFVAALRRLPQLSAVDDDTLIGFIEEHKLMGGGIRYVDCQLLASASLSSHLLWTRDKRLASAAEKLNIRYLIR